MFASVPVLGSCGIATKGSGTSFVAKFTLPLPEPIAAWLALQRGMLPKSDNCAPCCDVYSVIALRIRETSALLWTFRVSAKFLAGLIAMIVIAAKIAINAITTKISTKVNPEGLFLMAGII